ncbi:MAG TPA: nuclear transport factor 2 family protein [Pyrinomonadaceae bacterium]|nr:nuclear transport factor 2 family protein [Pyrinomonadaceae bacterium]
MKRCPTCQRTFTDESLSFCTEDGTPLTPVQDDEITRVAANSRDQDWSTPAYQPPRNIQPPPKQSRNAPWILVIIVAVVLGIVVGVIALFLLVPRMASRRQAANRPTANTNLSPAPSPSVNAEPPKNENSNLGHEESQPPADKDQVLEDLTAIENDWTVANVNADKAKLEQILGDDFVGAGPDGRVLGKVEYIDTIQRESEIEKWEFEDLQLTLRGERATLSGKVRYELTDGQQLLNFTDRFVWRDGRWQATSSEVTAAK